MYWFYIDGIVHISYRNSNLLCYHPYTGKVLEFEHSGTSEKVRKLIQKLLVPKNLRIIRISNGDLQDLSVFQFVHTIRDFYMGDLLDVSLSDAKPFQMPPIVKNEKDVKYLSSDLNRSMGENIMNYLDEITLYLNEECHHNCPMCHYFFKQTTCCTAKKASRHFLDSVKLKKLFSQIQGCRLTDLNISGGDFFLHPEWSELMALFQTLKARKTFYINYLNLAKHLDQLPRLNGPDTRIHLQITFPLDMKKLEIVWTSLSQLGIESVPRFFIQSSEEYNTVETLRSKLGIQSVDFFPIYNGANLDFFTENVFISRDDFEKIHPKPRFIYANSIVNSNYFGKLNILPDGRIYGNLHSPKLGTLGKESIYDCVFKEMKFGQSWRKLRENVMPCKQCNFQQLCPPISNHNFAIGRYNLCSIHLEPGRLS